VTEVDVEQRLVKSLDGYPAAEPYAEVLGLKVKDLNSTIFSKYPVTFSFDNEIYVRSIQKLEPDGSLKFYCAVEEGMVLEVADHLPMVKSLENEIEQLNQSLQSVDWFIGCNCILRSLEAGERNCRADLSKLISQNLSKRSIGFDTYGEQLNGLHMNQTLVGIAFGGKI
jgi:hypothetical protein